MVSATLQVRLWLAVLTATGAAADAAAAAAAAVAGSCPVPIKTGSCAVGVLDKMDPSAQTPELCCQACAADTQ